MTPDQILEQALQEAGLPVKYYEYSGTAESYIVYNEEAEEFANHGDNRALDRVTWWQVHLFAPKKSDFRLYKAEIERALREVGFGITDIVTLYEKETKTIHVVISCNTAWSMEERED